MQQFYARNDEVVKICTKCQIMKPASEFYSNKRNRDGLNSACRECLLKISNDFSFSESGKVRRKNYYNNIIKKDVPKYLFRTTALNAHARNLEHSIEIRDIIIPKFCPILGFELALSDTGYQQYNSPSIDRINSALGYRKDNIVIVSWRVNRIKSNASLNEIGTITKNWFSMGDTYNFDYPQKQKSLLYHARERSKKKNLGFELDEKDILIPFVCPILGIEISCNNSKQQHNSPSLDRIDNDLGYTKSNIRVISWRANDLKGDASFEEYKKVFDFYTKIMD
jgi:hypothetical protein